MKTLIDKNKIEYLNFLYNKSSEIRGKIIDHALSIEMILSDTLAHYFCTDKKKKSLCYSIVFNNNELNFSSKIKILKIILESTEIDLKSKFPKIIKLLDSVRITRNRIAHSALDTTDKFISKRFTDRIQLNFYGEGKKKQMVISDKDFKDIMIKSTLALTELISLQKSIIDQKVNFSK